MSYDPRAVKVSKSVKRVAATMTDKKQRREYIRGFALAEAVNSRMKTSRNRGGDKE